MMINNINPYQGQQNAVRPGGSNPSSAENRMVLPSGRGSAAAKADAQTADGQLLGLSERINALQKRSDMNLVADPPFFPIATYQRMDLIGEVRSIQVEVGKSSLRPELKQAVSSETIKDNATDSQLKDALDKLMALRDTLTRSLAVSKETIQPGSILKLEV